MLSVLVHSDACAVSLEHVRRRLDSLGINAGFSGRSRHLTSHSLTHSLTPPTARSCTYQITLMRINGDTAQSKSSAYMAALLYGYQSSVFDSTSISPLTRVPTSVRQSRGAARRT